MAEVKHCGRRLLALNRLRACMVCRRLFDESSKEPMELEVPTGVRVRLVSGGEREAGTYRSAAAEAPVTLSLERTWRARWAFQLVFATLCTGLLPLWLGLALIASLVLWGGDSPAAVVFVIPVVFLGVGLGYLALALAVNRTRIVVSAGEVSRAEEPFTRGWRAPVRVKRASGEQVRVAEERQNDIRNLSARWPPPKSHRVELMGRGGTVTVLVEQIASSASAQAIRLRITDMLRATAAAQDAP